jgi:hypothetical protein
MDKRVKKQMRNVQNQYSHRSVTNDVIKTEYEAYPGHLEKIFDEDDGLSNVEKSVVEHTTDGKTWNSVDE